MDLLTDFKGYLITEKKASANTIASYLRDVTQFWDYLGGRRPAGSERRQGVIDPICTSSSTTGSRRRR